ncbi:MAG: Do family serine endopeptidase [Candidatus Omnitrophica bacterium]|nr:Do family serine endopeptidase [Candidatus Omnitrophota bacterium]
MSRRSRTLILCLCGLILAIGLFAGRMKLWSESSRSPEVPRLQAATAQAAPQPAQPHQISLAESLEQAFVKVAEQAGPAVVSISTEQIEQVQRYYRGHPFFGHEPFDEFFREFFGDTPPREFKRFGLGSGVIIDARGFVLTNEHVVADADKITVTLADGREFTGEVKGKDPRADLAVIKIDLKSPPVARLGDSETLKTGQWAIALGNPFGLAGAGPTTSMLGPEPTLTVGVISALHRRLPRVSQSDRDYNDLVQTDAAINPGNSGGPLVNIQGEVIGINVAILTSSRGFEGVGFAIPINKAKTILDALIEGRKVLYGWLGIQIQDITDDVAEYYGLADHEGVLVYQVLADGPAQKAGVKDGDVVKQFDGKPVKNSRELVEGVSRTKVGRQVPIEVIREGKRLSLKIEVGARPSEGEATEGTGQTWRGLRVAELTPQLAEHFGFGADASGVAVIEVDPGSPTSEAGLEAGDVINEINRVPIGSLGDYRKVTARLQGNVLVRTNRGYVVVKPQ